MWKKLIHTQLVHYVLTDRESTQCNAKCLPSPWQKLIWAYFKVKLCAVQQNKVHSKSSMTSSLLLLRCTRLVSTTSKKGAKIFGTTVVFTYQSCTITVMAHRMSFLSFFLCEIEQVQTLQCTYASNFCFEQFSRLFCEKMSTSQKNSKKQRWLSIYSHFMVIGDVCTLSHGL